MPGNMQVIQDRPYYAVTKGVPAAKVRSYKQPIYDCEQVLSATPADQIILFQKPLAQLLADGTTRKTELHTNITTAGQFATPNSFDVFGFNARLPKDIGLTSWRNIMELAVVKVFFGTDNPYLTVPLEDIPSGVDTEGPGDANSPHIGWGTTDNIYRFDVGGRALHVNPTEAFRVECTFPSGGPTITGDQLLRWYNRSMVVEHPAARRRKAA